MACFNTLLGKNGLLQLKKKNSLTNTNGVCTLSRSVLEPLFAFFMPRREKTFKSCKFVETKYDVSSRILIGETFVGVNGKLLHKSYSAHWYRKSGKTLITSQVPNKEHGSFSLFGRLLRMVCYRPGCCDNKNQQRH